MKFDYKNPKSYILPATILVASAIMYKCNENFKVVSAKDLAPTTIIDDHSTHDNSQNNTYIIDNSSNCFTCDSIVKSYDSISNKPIIVSPAIPSDKKNKPAKGTIEDKLIPGNSEKNNSLNESNGGSLNKKSAVCDDYSFDNFGDKNNILHTTDTISNNYKN